MDIKDPRNLRVAASIPLPAGTTAVELESLAVATPAFTGDLVALALVPNRSCPAGAGARIAYFDVTVPAEPRSLSQTAGGAAVSLAQRRDGRVLALRADIAGSGVTIDDLTDPVHPSTLGQWRDPAPGGGACAGGVQLHDDGLTAVVVLPDGRVYDLGLDDPAQPSAAGAEGNDAATAGSGYPAILPLGNRTIAIVSAGADADACPDGAGPEPGLRVLVLDRERPPREQEPVRYPGVGAPGRLVASGELAYVAWHGAGVRVVDFGEVRARTVAPFAPEGADVVGVALLPDQGVVTDAGAGLYVLERPDEGGGRATFWSQFLSLFRFVGGAVALAALFMVPQVVARRAAEGAGSRAPSTVRVPGRSR